MSAIAQGIKKNKLNRYQLIKDDWKHYNKLGVPTTVIWEKYIYPKYYISRTTLYNVIGTNVTLELSELNKQLSLFD